MTKDLETLNSKKTMLSYQEDSFSIKAFFSQLGSSLMLPISLLPIAGIFIGVSSLLPPKEVFILSNIMYTMGIMLINNLPILFALSVAYSFSNNNSKAIIFALAAYLIFVAFQGSFIYKNDDNTYGLLWYSLESFYFTNIIGISVLNTSLFFGIIIGLIMGKVLKTFTNYHILILCTFMIGISSASFVLIFWPFIYYLLEYVFLWIGTLPVGIATFTYGFVNRLLLPFGLHSLLIPLVMYSPAGGVLLENGQIVAQGDKTIWLYLFGNDIPFQEAINNAGKPWVYNGNTYLLTEGTIPGQYQQGFLPIMIFAFPAAGLAMIRKTKDKKQKRIILIAAFTPMLTGITEPFEYLFVYTIPWLYFFHAFFTGLSFGLLSIMHTTIMLSSGWFLDVIFFGIIPALAGNPTNWWTIFVFGPIFSCIYYFLFHFLYKKPNENKTQIE